MEPITLIALESPDLSRLWGLLAGLPRDGIYLRRGPLLLETSSPAAPGFYGTAWRYSAADAPLLHALGTCGLLLTRGRDVLCCGDWDVAHVRGSIADGRVTGCATPDALARILL